MEVTHHKYLGVTITNDLTWSAHIADICSSSFSKLCFLRRKLRGAPSKLKRLAYITFIRSKLEYASVLWDPFIKKDIYQLEMVQRKAIRFIYNKYRRLDSPTTLMKTNNIQLLQVRRKMSRLLFLHNLLAHKLNISHPTELKQLSSRRTHHTGSHLLEPILQELKHSNTVFPEDRFRLELSSRAIFQSPNFVKALEEHLFE